MEHQDHRSVFLTGSYRFDLLLFGTLLLLMLLSGYRLRVYYRAEPVPQKTPPVSHHQSALPWRM